LNHLYRSYHWESPVQRLYVVFVQLVNWGWNSLICDTRYKDYVVFVQLVNWGWNSLIGDTRYKDYVVFVQLVNWGWNSLIGDNILSTHSCTYERRITNYGTSVEYGFTIVRTSIFICSPYIFKVFSHNLIRWCGVFRLPTYVRTYLPTYVPTYLPANAYVLLIIITHMLIQTCHQINKF
jgi:hypothetical protein